MSPDAPFAPELDNVRTPHSGSLYAALTLRVPGRAVSSTQFAIVSPEHASPAIS
jgi:hypothetical protein